MNLRPQELPEVRAALLDFTATPRAREYWQALASHARAEGGERSAEQLERATRNGLAGDLFFVARPMADLASVAGQSLPFFDMNVEDVPSRTGLMLFESAPADLYSPRSAFTVEPYAFAVVGGAWEITEDESCVWITPIVLIDGDTSLTIGQPALFPFIPASKAPSVHRSLDVTDRFIRTLRSSWLLMQQPLAADQVVEPRRSTQKRLRRAGYDPGPVRVIELRRPQGAPGEASEGRDWQHQWIVRGHWRQQWYPSRQVHRPVWIAPHVKGPEGAPMIGGEKVHVWRR
ncbi:hypothetical protein [Kitasatospora terrestris]|uniref:Uncharacterized protein n=1 Tax=Kitasatospora terrestris TaxID=258051 RepID=A0ABP9DPK4_9ACTN